MKDLTEIIIRGYDRGESTDKLLKKLEGSKPIVVKKPKKAVADKTKKMK